MFAKLKKLLSSYWPLLLILVVVGTLFFIRLGRNPLWDWDECIYAQYSKEIKATGDVITNHWNSSIRMEKPTLFFALMQIPYLFGINEFTTRILTAIFGLLLIVFTYLLSQKFFSRTTAVLSTLLLLTGESVIIYSLRLNTELPFATLVLAGVYFFLSAREKRFYSYLAGVLFGVAVMIKGLSVQFLPPLFLATFINFKKEKLIHFLEAMAAFLVVILPWHIAQFVMHGGEFYKVYIYENIIQKVNNPVEFHFGGRLYYIKLFATELLPWIGLSVVLPIYYLIHFKIFLKKKTMLAELKKQEVIFTVLLFVLVPLVLLTRAQTKIAWYIISIYPFLCIYLGYCLTMLLDLAKKKYKAFYTVCFTLLVVLISADAGRLMMNEIRPLENKVNLSHREKALVEVRKQPQKQLDYLVQFSERRARETLASNLATSTTFIYGGNPCAVYSTGKKVNYYYEIPTFQKRVKSGHGLYLLENGDLWTVKDLPVEKVYGDTDFTLFTN